MSIETLKIINRKANKIHQCDLCLGDIEKGETYENQTNKMDDNVYTFKSHLTCINLCKDLDMFQNPDEGVNSAIFSDYVIEEYIEQIDKNYDNWEGIKSIKQLVSELQDHENTQ